jgi:mRNA interferase MazF
VAPERGEVWQVDFGIAQKVRPALVISIPYGDEDRALIGVIPHFTSVRGSRFEVSVPVRFLSEGAFLVQGIQALPPKYFLRRMGVLTREQLQPVERTLLFWLGISRSESTVRS